MIRISKSTRADNDVDVEDTVKSEIFRMHTKDILGNFLADSYAVAVGFSSILHLFKICFPINLWEVYFVLVLIVLFIGRRLQNVILFYPSKRIDDSQKRIDGNLGRDI